MPSESDTTLDYFIELGCGFAIKQWSHLLASLLVERTAVHRLERGLIFKFHDSGVGSSFEGLQKLSADKALEIREGVVGCGKPFLEVRIFAIFNGWEGYNHDKHTSPPGRLLVCEASSVGEKTTLLFR
jgi:hypothetical protein